MVIEGIYGAPPVNNLVNPNTTAVSILSQNAILPSPRTSSSLDSTDSAFPAGVTEALAVNSEIPGAVAEALSVNSLIDAAITASQAQETLQPQGLNFSNLNASATSINDRLAFALSVDSLNNGDTTGSHVSAAISPLNADIRANSTAISAGIAKSVKSLPNVPKYISTTLQPSSNMGNSNLSIPSTRTVLAPGVSTTLPSPGTDPQPDLTSGTQTPTADSNFKCISPSSHAVSVDLIATRGSDIFTGAQTLPSHRTHVLDDFGTPILLLSHTTALPSNRVKEPPPLTISGHTVTADSLGQYVINDQTLTRGGVVTVSGTKISLAANASDVIVGTSTEALDPSVTAELASGANGTEIQKFSGNALGARDGVTSSSILLLVSFLVLFWM